MDEQINLKYELEIINSSESRKSLKLNEHYEQTYLELAVEKFYSSFFQNKNDADSQRTVAVGLSLHSEWIEEILNVLLNLQDNWGL